MAKAKKVTRKGKGVARTAWAGVSEGHIDTWPGVEFGGKNPTRCLAIFRTKEEAELRYTTVVRVQIAEKGAKRGK